MLRFGVLMERELSRRGHSVTLLQPQPMLGKVRVFGGKLAKWLAYVDKFILFPRTLKANKDKFDLVHICDHSNAMYVKHLDGMPHVVTCHDVLAIKSALGEVPQNFVSATGRKFQQLILSGLKGAQFIVCDSEATRHDLLRIAGKTTDSVTVVYLSLNYPYSPMLPDEARGRLHALGFKTEPKFFVHVGGTVWYKNKLGVLQIFKAIRSMRGMSDYRLLMLGKPLSPSLLEFIASNNLAGAVEMKSGVSNEDLRAAYSLADGLIFPSLQEGFGWPILEAQACGCPVFTTGRAPMSEVGGEAAIYFEPSRPEEAADRIVSALDRAEAISSQGLDNVAKFSVDNMIDGYAKSYLQALSHHRDSL
jgi:glycosyltransferase involved in cell wall biosynthesis